jgi:hypothetical protein
VRSVDRLVGQPAQRLCGNSFRLDGHRLQQVAHVLRDDTAGSGLPQRLRPGFWDPNGRCPGTAGVLALACDQYTEGRDDLALADVLVDDLTARAVRDDTGARWSNREHRVTPSDLPPRTGWAMGNAGIVRELLRYARLGTDRDSTYAVTWPDHLPSAAS